MHSSLRGFFRDSRAARLIRPVRTMFRRARLETQFILIASMVVMLLMAGLAIWTTRSIEQAVLRGAGSVGTGYLRTFVGPMLGEDEIRAGRASIRLEKQLDLVVSHGVLHRHIAQLKIWNPDGTLFYSSSSGDTAEGEGELFAELGRAFAGEVVVSSTAEPKHFYSGDEIDQGLIEIYAPLVEDEEGTVRLVGEFYENPGFLLAEMAQAWWRTTLYVLAFSLPLLGLLYCIVRRGSLVIDRQHLAMWDGLRRALELAKQNERLRYDAESTRREAGKLNEKVLDQIGWELHDGPIQTLTLIGLSLSDLVANQGQAAEIRIASSSLKDLDTLTRDVLEEIRDLSGGLILPELEGLSLKEAIMLAVQRHRDLTGHPVGVHGDLPDLSINHLNICVYRFVQEALINAHHHARGNRRQVRYKTRAGNLLISVTDTGDARPTQSKTKKRLHLGTITQRKRIRAFGGKLRVRRGKNGTMVFARLPLDNDRFEPGP